MIREFINIVEGMRITDAWFKDGGFKTYKRPAKERYEIADKPGTIDTLEGPVKYPAGYYIMTGPKGEQYPITPEKFAELKRLDILLNKTREELARDYTTNAEVQRITDHIDQRFNRLEAKIDQLIQKG